MTKRRGTRLPVQVLLIVGGLLAALLAAAPAHAATARITGTGQIIDDIDARTESAPASEPTGPRGTLSGQVTDEPGVPLAGVTVLFERFTSNAFRYEAEVLTDGSGRYTTALPVGKYRLRFRPAYLSPHVAEYYDDSSTAADARVVEVRDEALTPGIDARLARAATLRGTVGPVPAPGGSTPSAYAYRLVDGQWVFHEGAYVEEDGTYEIASLPGGIYRLQFSGTRGLVGEYYDDAADLESATDIVLTPGQTRVIDAELTATSSQGSVSGMVRDAEGEPVYADVVLYRWTQGRWSRSSNILSGPTGNYTLSAPAGTYRLGFDAHGFHREFWGNATTFADATQFRVEDGEDRTGFDARLTGRSVISGELVEDDGTPVPDGTVLLHRAVGDTWDEWGRIRLADNRTRYEFDGLPPGRFRAEFRPAPQPYGSPRIYAGEFWNGADSFAEAQDIVVGQVERRDGIDGHFTPVAQNSSLSGTVSGEGVEDLGAVKIVLTRQEGETWVADGVAFTDAQGRWSLDRLRAGNYRILHVDESGDYASTYLGGSPLESEAVVVTLTADEQRADVDQTLPRAAVITGRAVGPSGDPVGAAVFAYRRVGDGWLPVGQGLTSSTTGRYQIDALAPGTYRLRFTLGQTPATDLADAFWGGSGTIESGTNLDLVAGVRRDGVDHQFAVGARISGRITTSGGERSPHRVVRVSQFVNGEWDDADRPAVFDVDGSYVITGLADGRYRVVSHGGHLYRTTWWGGATEQDDADVLTLTAQEERAGVDIDLPAVVVCGDEPARMQGRPQVGSPITLFPGTWETPGIDLTYAWYVAGVRVEGETAEVFVPRAQDAGQSITATVTAARAGYLPTTVHARASGEVVFPDLPQAVTGFAPTIEGTPQVGRAVSVDLGTGHAPGTAFSYIWAADGRAVPGARGATYTPGPTQRGNSLVVLVTAERSGYAATSALSPASASVRAGTISVSRRPRLVGRPMVTKRLRVRTPVSSPKASLRYRWFLNGRRIKGSGRVIRVRPWYAGKRVQAKVLIRAVGYESKTLRTQRVRVRPTR